MRAALCVVSACAMPIDPEPLGDYTRWPDEGGTLVEVAGDAPGHANSIRRIYVDPIAADPAQTLDGGYAVGSRIAKEVYELDGALRYVVIMRRLAIDGPDGGWLFSESDVPQGPEHTAGFCWARCHVAAPYLGAWYDYRR